ncbi:hypothetical protein BC829DRAFT_189497 [Chytridium lagenaria]|nr:hypothetical protein BC829DRAFT_189497 [Chytridium lagenaria]
MRAYEKHFFSLRRHEYDIRATWVKLLKAKNNSRRSAVIRQTGISKISIFYKLRAVSWPASFALDLMHLSSNISKYMFDHWEGRYFSRSSGITSPGFFDSRQRAEMSNVIDKNLLNLPSSFGRPPSKLFEDGGLKSEEWKTWSTLISVPLLKGYLPQNHLLAWSKFADVLQFCHNAPSFDQRAVDNIRNECYNFYKFYESEYYQYKEEYLSACRSVFHYILHIPDVIEQMGPMWSYWQYPIERLIGMLQPLLKS